MYSTPASNLEEEEEPTEHWDGSYATANTQHHTHSQRNNSNSRSTGTLVSKDSQLLRRSLEKSATAFESILDNAMHRNVARRKAREREREDLLEIPPRRAQLQLQGLPRTKRELYNMVQQLRTIRAEHEGRIDDLNRAIVLHRSTTRRQATKIAVLEKASSERDQQDRAQEAATKGKLWKTTAQANLDNHNVEMMQSLKVQEKLQAKRLQQALERQDEKLIQQNEKVVERVNQAVNEAVKEALLVRDALQAEHEVVVRQRQEQHLNATVQDALRKQKEWMLQEEEKMMEGVKEREKKTEAHQLADMKAQHLESRAMELAASNASNDKLVAELRRELVEQERRSSKKIQQLETTHEKELNEIVRQEGNMVSMRGKEEVLKQKVQDYQMEIVMLQSEIIELRNGGFSGFGIAGTMGEGEDGGFAERLIMENLVF